MEKEYKDFSRTAKKGANKFGNLSTKGMRMYGEKYRKQTGRNPNNVNNKESFYSFVQRSRLRKKR